MAEKITFLAGRAGSGKSRLVRRMIREALAAGRRAVLIVPEQFTYETERALAAELGAGLLDVSVFSFTTLARRVLRETGERAVFLSAQGKRMAIRRIVEEEKEHLRVFSGVCGKNGFSETCAEVFTLLKRFDISPEILQQAASHMEADSLVQDKLTDIALLYARTEGYLASRYLDEEDAINALTARLGASSIAGCDVFVDGFDLMTEQLYRAVEALMRASSRMVVSVLCDFSPRCRDSAVFAPEKRVYTRLFETAKQLGLATELVSLPLLHGDSPAPRTANKVLSHLEKELFAYPSVPFGGDIDGAIRVFASHSRAGEVQAVADAVLACAQQGMRYRDMAVIAPDMDTYSAELMRVFARSGIPVFADAKHKLTAFPAAELVSAALKACLSGFAMQDVLRVVKTRLVGLTGDEEELFENYVLRYGIRGSLFQKPFARGEVPRAAEAARIRVMEPLMTLRAGLARGNCATKTEALYAYLCTLDVQGQIAALVATLKEQGRLELMEENAQVFNTLMEVFSQLHAILGDEPVSNAKYLLALEEGLSAYEVGAIPATADQVLFGSIARTRARNIKALFVLGCIDGALPAVHQDDGMIGDTELSALKELGVSAWGGSDELYETDTLDLYSVLTKPSERLYLSYPLSVSGESAEVSPIITRLHELFPQMTEETDIGNLQLPRSEDAGFLALVKRLRSFVDTQQADDELAALFAYYQAKPAYHAQLARVLSALYENNSPEPFGRELSEKLYGLNLSGSATRFETFNRCPFMHFVRYGLCAEERRVFKERPLDAGTFYHAALEKYVNEVVARGLDWNSITREACHDMISEFLPELMATHNDGVLLDSARARADARRMIASVKDTAYAVTRQMAAGSFRPLKTELSFGPGGDYPALTLRLADGSSFEVCGKIDRVDEAQVDGENYIRIIDYKTGGVDFELADLEAGIRLQLPLYLEAIRATEAAAKTAGMYYMPVGEGVVQQAGSEEAVEDAILKQFRLRGLSLSDVSVLRAADSSAPSWSSVLSVQFKKDGGVRASASLLNAAALAEKGRLARAKAQETLEKIRDGHADVTPFRKKKKTACQWCEYKSVCRFDVRFPGSCYHDITPGGGEVQE